MRYRIGLMAIAFSLLFIAAPSYSQATKPAPATTGTIHGVVTGLNGKVVENAHVYLRPAGDSAKQHVGITNFDGIFEFPKMAPGTYEIKADRGNKQSAWQKSVSLKAGGDVNLSLKLDQDIPHNKPSGE